MLDKPDYVHTVINHLPLIGLLVSILHPPVAAGALVARFEVRRANRVSWSRTGSEMAKEGNTLKRG